MPPKRILLLDRDGIINKKKKVITLSIGKNLNL